MNLQDTKLRTFSGSDVWERGRKKYPIPQMTGNKRERGEREKDLWELRGEGDASWPDPAISIQNLKICIHFLYTYRHLSCLTSSFQSKASAMSFSYFYTDSSRRSMYIVFTPAFFESWLFLCLFFLSACLFFFLSLCVRTFWDPWLKKSINQLFTRGQNCNFLNIRARKILKTVLEILDEM